MRWQRPYLNVPMDDYVTSPRYRKLKSTGSEPPKLNDLIGPHVNRSINLMKLRRKPLAMVPVRDLEFWIEHIIENGWKVMQIPQDVNNRATMLNWDILIYLPDQRWRAEKLIRVLSEESGFLANVKLGYLFGYTKRCIRTFLTRTELLRKAAALRTEILKDPRFLQMGELEIFAESETPPDFVMP